MIPDIEGGGEGGVTKRLTAKEREGTALLAPVEMFRDRRKLSSLRPPAVPFRGTCGTVG